MNIGASTALTTSLSAITLKFQATLIYLTALITNAASDGKFSITYKECPKELDRYLREYGYKVVWDGNSAIISW